MDRPILVTGGAGFVGSALTRRLLKRGHRVLLVDDLSREGSRERLASLRRGFPQLSVALLDVADGRAVDAVVRAHGPFAAVFHLAAQVAVTWAMQDPHRDFLSNAVGSFHVIDAVRRHSPGARCLYMSSNKVYGDLADLGVEEDGPRLRLVGLPQGVGLDRPLDPSTPYGVSKATGECYFRDASRTYGIQTLVLRCSCIYGPAQSQQEDQGWVAWFAKAVAQGLPLRIFGDGRTTRDMLFVDDLIDLYLRFLDGPPPPVGCTLNVGGGAAAARSLLEVVEALEQAAGRAADYSHHDERPSDQKVFVTDCSEAARVYGWRPTVQPEDGLRRLLAQGGPR